MTHKQRAFDFQKLVEGIRKVHEHCIAQAGKAVNITLTLRNWSIGCYLQEYEQRGEDRAAYGTRLLENLAGALQSSLDRCYTGRYLRLCRQFYATYPQIRKSLISEFALPTKRNRAKRERERLRMTDFR